MPVGAGVGGRGATLNLVPFLDLLSVCITFLMATAVWIDLDAIDVDPARSGSGPSGAAWRLVVRADAYEVARGEGIVTDRDVDRAVAAVDGARGEVVVVAAADGVPWERVVGALDGLGRAGYAAAFDPAAP